MARMKDRKDAILYIAGQGHGTKESLISEIGEELYDQFCYMGFIRKGVTVTGQEKPASTWRITELGKKQKDFYREPDQREKELGKLYFSLDL